ncbi:hypothetical protein THRCLA_11263, partial [Thraustotheca clavata]
FLSSSCFSGFTGPQCEYLTCPSGIAWWDYATANDEAHAQATCSNMGICSYTTGVCTCNTGFQGPACETMACPTCANGRCLSMRDAAQSQDDVNFFYTTSYGLWDADKIFGCQCDCGFTGYDCSLRTCPVGDDPMTTVRPVVQFEGQTSEVQMLNCLCNGCAGYFALYYQGFLTANILPTATAAQLQTALNVRKTSRIVTMALQSIHGVTVTLSSGTTVCPTAGAVSSIIFTKNGGSLPLIQIKSMLSGAVGSYAISLSGKGTAGLYDSIGNSVTGTTEVIAGFIFTEFTLNSLQCSGRGDCNQVTGICTCVPGFSSSNGTLSYLTRALNHVGAGAIGTVNDCGYGTTAACPQMNGVVCNGQGTCNAGTFFRCVCNAPYTGAYCTLLQCPTGAAWFDGASATNTAHAVATCSNRLKGICNPSTGVCACQAGFTGAACELLACPGSPSCSGQGTCKTMQQLAALATTNGNLLGVTYGNTPNYGPTWDYNKIQGCYCQQNYYMGPYSGAMGNFQAYDCSARSCPYGDDPYQPGVDQKQTISCTADGGSFTITFRQITTAAIAASATAATVQTAFQALPTIVSALVTFSNGATSVCSAAGVVTTVQFTYAQGALPQMTSTSSLTLTTGAASISTAITVAGTKANLECSGRGTCDRTKGVCNCYDYFLSSDGNGNFGTRGDCGYKAPWSTKIQTS